MLALPNSFVTAIIDHARQEMPNEVCGIVAGRNGKATRLYQTTNADASPVKYTVEPGELLSILLELREKDWDVLAIYHSHTHSPAFPSETDVRQAVYPGSYYVIVSLARQDDPVLRAFRIVKDSAPGDHDGSTIEEVELKVVEG